jgi:23S rRNA pseudouridine1911/1915/1917 synthase
MSQLLELEAETTADRLDRYLAEQLSDLSRARLQKLIAEGQVQVNGVVCTSKKVSVDLGDLIQIEIPEAVPIALEPEAIPLDILYEDEDLIIVNKPAGMVVHPSIGHYSGTLVNALLAHCGDTLPGINGVQRPGIVHRLDKDTTGAIAIAKTAAAMVSLLAQFKVKTARRSYLAIVQGVPKTETGTVDEPIGRHPSDRQKMAVVSIEQGGRRAVTHWQILERLGPYTLMQFDLETGRTHQIRVHAAHLTWPVVGDQTYGKNTLKLKVKLPGQALHAWRLRLIHPTTAEAVEAIAPPPEPLLKLLTVLRQQQN